MAKTSKLREDGGRASRGEDVDRFLKEIQYINGHAMCYVRDNGAIRPASFWEWSEDYKNRQLYQDQVGPYFISTIFDGLLDIKYVEDTLSGEHDFPVWKPRIARTAVFDDRIDDGNPKVAGCDSWSLEEAEQNHKRMVEKYKRLDSLNGQC